MKRLKCFGQLSKDAFLISSLRESGILNTKTKFRFFQLVQFVHDIISNLHGAINRGNKQTDMIIVVLTQGLALMLYHLKLLVEGAQRLKS